MNTVLDIVSKTGTSMLVFSVVYFVSRLILDKIFKLRVIIFKRFLLSDVISFGAGMMVLLFVVTITSPYK